MVSLRPKVRPDLPSHFLGTGRSFGHWQVFLCRRDSLAPNCAHGSSQWHLEPSLMFFFRSKLPSSRLPWHSLKVSMEIRSDGHLHQIAFCFLLQKLFAPNCAHGSSSQWHLEPSLMFFFRSKLPSSRLPWHSLKVSMEIRSDGHLHQIAFCFLLQKLFAPNCAHGSSSQWHLEPFLMFFFRWKLRSDLPSQFLGRGRSVGHWQVPFDFFLAPNWAHGSFPHQGSVSTMDAVCVGPARMPATCFTKASSTAKNDSMDVEDFAMIGTQIEESFAQTSEETEICLKRLQRIHLSSFDCSSQGEGDHTSNSANHVELRQQNHGDQKTSNKNAMQHVATPVHPSHLSIQLRKHKAGCTNRLNFIRILP